MNSLKLAQKIGSTGDWITHRFNLPSKENHLPLILSNLNTINSVDQRSVKYAKALYICIYSYRYRYRYICKQLQIMYTTFNIIYLFILSCKVMMYLASLRVYASECRYNPDEPLASFSSNSPLCLPLLRNSLLLSLPSLLQHPSIKHTNSQSLNKN